MPREFTCIDCGCLVTHYGETAANDDDLCVECSWLRDIADPVEREKLRAWLKAWMEEDGT
jgi:hypothetical protein